eukprot:TRINITY_DN544_c1_g1_i2.p1 TRINITY_DN544_c1_g1~~TRINITY_DN544_c1_g1_i2.p1  ORF type:complete len:248 (-),score=30.40 TRINITY_DN544_c1_g1_i2:67-810(-)
MNKDAPRGFLAKDLLLERKATLEAMQRSSASPHEGSPTLTNKSASSPLLRIPGAPSSESSPVLPGGRSSCGNLADEEQGRRSPGDLISTPNRRLAFAPPKSKPGRTSSDDLITTYNPLYGLAIRSKRRPQRTYSALYWINIVRNVTSASAADLERLSLALDKNPSGQLVDEFVRLNGVQALVTAHEDIFWRVYFKAEEGEVEVVKAGDAASNDRKVFLSLTNCIYQLMTQVRLPPACVCVCVWWGVG